MKGNGRYNAGRDTTMRGRRDRAGRYVYDCQVTISRSEGSYLTADIKRRGRVVCTFNGPVVGRVQGYTGWGTASFDTPVEELIGRPGRFEVEVGGTTRVQIFDGRHYLGGCSVGGVGIGDGSGTGGGSFDAR